MCCWLQNGIKKMKKSPNYFKRQKVIFLSVKLINLCLWNEETLIHDFQLSQVYGLRKKFKHIFLFPVYMRGEGRRGKEDKLLSTRLCSLSSAPSSIVFSFNLLLCETRMEITPKKTPATQGSRLHDTLTDLHKFPCLVTASHWVHYTLEDSTNKSVLSSINARRHHWLKAR